MKPFASTLPLLTRYGGMASNIDRTKLSMAFEDPVSRQATFAVSPRRWEVADDDEPLSLSQTIMAAYYNEFSLSKQFMSGDFHVLKFDIYLRAIAYAAACPPAIFPKTAPAISPEPPG